MPGHQASRPVAAAVERLLVAAAAYDEGFGTHGAWDDPHDAFRRAYGTLAGDEHVLPEVVLALHVVVMAVDRSNSASKGLMMMLRIARITLVIIMRRFAGAREDRAGCAAQDHLDRQQHPHGCCLD